MKKEENKKIDLKKEIRSEVLFISSPIIMILFMIIFLDISVGVYYPISLKSFVFTLLLMAVINVFLTLITGNSKRSVIIQSIILIIALFINNLRFIYTGEVFSLSDFAYIFELHSITGIVENTLVASIIRCLPYFCIFLILIIIYIFIIEKNNFVVKYSFKKRALLSLIPFVILVFLFNPPKFLRNGILNNIYYSNDVNVNSLNIHNYASYTMLGGMYMLHLENKVYEPNDYNKEEVQNMIANYEENDEETWEEANIIVTFSESFFDVSLLEDDIVFDKEITSNFNALKEEGIFINMISPTYGGLSSNVEFQLLTGNTLNFFSSSYVPFMTYYKTTESRKALSLAKELRNNDYYTKVVFGLDFYNSRNSYLNLGINEYEQKDVISKHKGNFVADEYLMDETIKAFNEKESGQKLFYMNCTIQSHQTYEVEKYENYDISVKSTNLSQNHSDIVKTYSQGIYDADIQLRKNV